MIRFEEITNKNIWKVCMLEPFEEQKDFVAENIQSLDAILKQLHIKECEFLIRCKYGRLQSDRMCVS